MTKLSSFALFGLAATSIFSYVKAAEDIHWIDWTRCASLNGITCYGTLTTNAKTITVEYNNPRGIGFSQTAGASESHDYFSDSARTRNPSTSPYTSATVPNIPPKGEMIALRYAGTQTLTFSESVRNVFFAYISLNGNGYGFDQDFEVLSFGASSDGNACGYWGCGTSSKSITTTEYQLVGTGEPHGTIVFADSFDTLSWRSLSDGKSSYAQIDLDRGTPFFLFFSPFSPSSDFLQNIGMVLLLEFPNRRKSIKRALILPLVEILISRHGPEQSMISMGFAT